MDRKEQEALFSKYESMARRIARSFRKNTPPAVLTADLEAAALMGLWDAIQRGRHAGKEAFEPYAVQRVRGAILDEIRRQDWLPRYTRRRVGAPKLVYFEQLMRAEAEATSLEPDAEQQAIMRDLVRELHRAVALVIPSQYLPTLMMMLAGARQKDVAQARGVSEERISQVMAICKGLLRREFQRREFSRRPRNRTPEGSA